jgi:UDP:flavonoid glycosyltransferase YjiC (YdhE family)
MRSARGPGALTIYLGAFGQPGHAFPMLALGARLAARGHRVAYETWSRWREPVEAAGMEFVAAPEYPVFPTRERPLKPYEAVVLAAAESRRAIVAELEGIPFATLIPHVNPVGAPGFPPYSFGARIPRTRLGSRLWRTLDQPVERGLRRGRTELNETRSRLGLPPVHRLHGGLSPHLCLFATFPQLEYPRAWPPEAHIVGPLMWEPPSAEVEPPPGEQPLVLVAPSTAQDPEQRLLTCALEGLAGEPIRVLATTNRKPLPGPIVPPANARLVEWLSYSRTIPQAALVVCHAGHGTVVRALACGTPLLAVPHSGDMAENAARIDWAGVGVRLPWRLLSPGTLRFAVRRSLGEQRFAIRARALARWARDNDGPTRAAELVEELALSRRAAHVRTR